MGTIAAQVAAILVFVAGLAVMIGAKKRGIQLIIMAVFVVIAPRLLSVQSPPGDVDAIDEPNISCIIDASPLDGVTPLSLNPSYGYFDTNYLVEEDRQHLGIDIPATVGMPVASPANTIVVANRTNGPDVMQAVLILRDPARGIEHVFGHVSSDLVVGSEVGAGDIVANIRKWPNNSHLHWGINLQSAQLAQGKSLEGAWGWGRAPASASLEDAGARGWADPKTLVGACS